MKNFKKVLSVVLSMTICLTTVAGCVSPNDSGNNVGVGVEEKVDKTRTQLYVGNYNGGYGYTWLQALKTRFENFYKDESFEDGKVGVQVLVDNKKEEYKSLDTLGATIETSKNAVYFIEGLNYDQLRDKGWVLDISEALSTPLTEYGESKSIYDKMSAQQKNYYIVNGGQCYAVPTYSAYFGTIYDIDLFEDYLLYFAAEEDNGNDGFITSLNDTLSNGPDGKPNTDDDGLPATYDEFFKLCERMDDSGIIPMIWSGQYMSSYMRQYAAAFMVDYEGEQNTRINFDYNGTCDTIVSGYNLQGEPILSTVEITMKNGYEVSKQAGKFYSLDFVEKIVDNEYYHPLSTNITLSHMGAQEEFLFSKYEAGSKPIAMLADGIWWESEATDAFNTVVEGYGDGASKQNRRFGFMPYPKATKDKVGEGITLYDGLLATSFVNANVKGVTKDLAMKLIRFANTDESLREFTRITNTPKALEYSMEESDLSSMTEFGRSVYKMKTNADVVYAYSADSFGRSVRVDLIDAYQTLIDGLPYADVAKTFKDYPNYTSKMYFEGLAKYNSQSKWEQTYGSLFD